MSASPVVGSMIRKVQFNLILSFLILSKYTLLVQAGFKSKKKKEAEALAAQLALEAEKAAKFVTLPVLGIEADKILVRHATFGVVYILLLSMTIFFLTRHGNDQGKGNRAGQADTLDVVLVGSGLPKKGMGWYHLTQLLDMKNVNVKAVVEPFFLNKKLNPNPPSSFTNFVSETSALGVQFVSSIDELESFDKPTMCLIAGRTADNPKLFKECANKGASCIYLEKPGAPSVSDLQEMKQLADILGVQVYIGYNKNVTPYVRKALELAETIDGSHVSFQHNNSYKKNELPECFERNAEGMLKNMAIHELALLVTFFGVTVNTIEEFKVLDGTTQLQLQKPSSSTSEPKFITDFEKIAFQVTTKTGQKVSVSADRCGGNVSHASVRNAEGKEVKKFEFPDLKEQEKVDALAKADPEMMPYFFVQSDDYLELKTRVVDACLKNTTAQGVATITVAIEALKLAEYGKKQLSQ